LLHHIHKYRYYNNNKWYTTNSLHPSHHLHHLPYSSFCLSFSVLIVYVWKKTFEHQFFFIGFCTFRTGASIDITVWFSRYWIVVNFTKERVHHFLVKLKLFLSKAFDFKSWILYKFCRFNILKFFHCKQYATSIHSMYYTLHCSDYSLYNLMMISILNSFHTKHEKEDRWIQ